MLIFRNLVKDYGAALTRDYQNIIDYKNRLLNWKKIELDNTIDNSLNINYYTFIAWFSCWIYIKTTRLYKIGQRKR